MYTGYKLSRISAATKHGAVIRKGHTKGVGVVDELDGLVEGKGPKGRRADPALGKTHASGAGGGSMTVVIGHIPVKEIAVIPSDDPRVGSNISEAAVDVVWGNRVKGTTDVEKGDKAVRLGIDVSLCLLYTSPSPRDS